MRKIKVKPLTAENFKHYGSFASMVNPEGPSLGDFYNDQVEFPVSGINRSFLCTKGNLC